MKCQCCGTELMSNEIEHFKGYCQRCYEDEAHLCDCGLCGVDYLREDLRECSICHGGFCIFCYEEEDGLCFECFFKKHKERLENQYRALTQDMAISFEDWLIYQVVKLERRELIEMEKAKEEAIG